MEDCITQHAHGNGYPILASLVERLSYREGWAFELVHDLERGQDSAGTTLIINVTASNSSHSDQTITVTHYMIVPPASYNERSWRMWIFEQIGLVELHERMEFFKIDDKTVYPPAHGPGNNPYLVLEYGTDTDRRMSFRGNLNPE